MPQKVLLVDHVFCLEQKNGYTSKKKHIGKLFFQHFPEDFCVKDVFCEDRKCFSGISFEKKELLNSY